MCGIAGHIGSTPLALDRVMATIDTMKRRGPDHQATSRLNARSESLTLIHSRLSIIDLDPRSNQPYQFEHLHLAFNGEIYDYLEHRAALAKLGYHFETDSDTEVLIKAFHCWGPKAFEMLEGMWAISLYDENSGALWLCRDRFAEKPLYVHRGTDGLYFASEIKQLCAMKGRSFSINEQHVRRFLVNGHKSLNKTGEQFYDGVEEVAPGSYWKITAGGSVEQHKYWNPEFRPVAMDEHEAVGRIQEALIRSVELRMRADVPLAFCLSGGVDSSAMASIAAKSLGQEIQTFSIIDKDPRYNELENIQATIDDLGCDHHLVELSADFDYLDRLSKLIEYHDAPVATISYLVHSRLIESMASTGFKVSISGTGADELFTGYYDHFLLQLHGLTPDKRVEQVKYWEEFPAKQVRNPFLQDPMRFVKDPSFRDHIYLNNNAFSGFLKGGFEEAFSESHYTDDLLRNRMLNELYHEVVRVILREDDLNAMFYSIENRSPFLDAKLFEVAYSIPSELLIQKGFNKYLLRESMKGILNETVRTSREKKGFNASIHSVINFEDAQQRAAILDNSAIFDWVRKDKVESLMNKGEMSNSYKKFFFNFLNVKIWLDGQ